MKGDLDEPRGDGDGAHIDDVYVQGLAVEGDKPGLNEVHICVGSPHIARLRDGVLAGFQQYVVDKHLKRLDFGGKVVVVILSEIAPAGSSPRGSSRSPFNRPP